MTGSSAARSRSVTTSSADRRDVAAFYTCRRLVRLRGAALGDARRDYLVSVELLKPLAVRVRR